MDEENFGKTSSAWREETKGSRGECARLYRHRHRHTGTNTQTPKHKHTHSDIQTQTETQTHKLTNSVSSPIQRSILTATKNQWTQPH
jgi:hypothetical protein